MSTEEDDDDDDDDDDARDCIARALVWRASNGVGASRDDACAPNMLWRQSLSLAVAPGNRGQLARRARHLYPHVPTAHRDAPNAPERVAMADTRDESTPLVARDDATATRRARLTSAARRAAAVVGVLACALGCYDVVSGRAFSLGTITNWAFAGVESPNLTFTLDASWIAKDVRAANKVFFTSPLSKAFIVKHNFGSSSFFKEEERIPMTRVGLRKWMLTTTSVNYEYGFMLENEAGEKLREIGPAYVGTTGDVVAPSKFMKDCTVAFGKYRNRLVSQKTGASSNIKACFASCDKDCVLPDAPKPIGMLDASDYTGGSKWSNSQFSCALGSETTYDQASKSFYISGTQNSLIICPHDIGPKKHPDFTIEVVFKLDPTFDAASSYGWIFGHDNGGYDRSFIISDERFGGGVASGVGGVYNSGMPTPTKGVWHHGLAVFRQGVKDGSYTALDGVRSPRRATANNNEGLPNFSIGGLVGIRSIPHSMKGYIRYFNFYEGALSEDQIEAMYVKNTPWP
jgi:hypothetical protein